ncbi:ABC transporter permease [Mechercharimyces sp. CAU 1602]|uniref:ABC transporter permease n=1 Tax=Mechercharimyces sp. CAU 1602 TaxID=2973933 RepID=UPI0021624E99|nr:ABC transporter permease [Mechercharimyces sp. CAU 1602]MCS1352533.1 ABC transporter permease [Mechercharimyces sp. CAU 1602]
MANLIRLIQNENMKTYRRIGTLVMIGLILLASLAHAMLSKHQATGSVFGDIKVNNEWQESLKEENNHLQQSLNNSEDLPADVMEQWEEQIALNQYRLDHDLPPTESTFWGFMNQSVGLVTLIILFTVIVSSISIAGEFSWGTIKLLLIRSASRSKILLSKYISSFLFALSLLLLTFISSFLFGALLFGFDQVDSAKLLYQDGKVIEKSMIASVLGEYGLATISLLIIVTFAFAISSIFRSSAVAIGTSIFLMFASQPVIVIASIQDINFVKYYFLANTDLSIYLSNSPPYFDGQTLSFSLAILAIHWIIFIAVSWIVFNKRDIAA